ncbi:hypothetical protein F4808DRAFT_456695 [Astrocystis sublimbata]|nr:hypothetical protein F4808DRAFT_456695 [Astrocystis sublimbata]
MHRPAALSRPRSICQICESIATAQRRRAASPLIAAARNATQRASGPRHLTSASASLQKRALSTTIPHSSKNAPTAERRPDELAQVKSSVAGVMTFVQTLLSKPTLSEQEASAALEVCAIMAARFTDESVQPQLAHAISQLDSTASTLLSLDEEDAKSSAESPLIPEHHPAELRESIDKISDTAYSIVAYPPVFITPKLLKQYVRVQAKLGRPQTIPAIFQLYATKPVLEEGSSPPKFTAQNPHKAANAIESDVVDMALDTAIAVKNLDAAVGIVENSYGTTAFMRSKLLRKGLLPFCTLAATPPAAYILATKFADSQQAMDSGMATGVAFAGILTYVGFTASLGLVALTTMNDHHKRVSWAPGRPLRKRWIREEERAALDKIACAWGFKDEWRKGEEEGADWDALKEYCGQKGMILDRTELMEGMS